MRWSSLFDDLEAQLDRSLDAEQDELRAEEERLRLARLTLRDRLGALGPSVTLRLRGDETVRLDVETFGADWVSGALRSPLRLRATAIVPFAGIDAVVVERSEDVTRSLVGSSASGPRDRERLPVTSIVRALARRRTAVELVTRTGRRTGTIDRAGRDHVDLAVHSVEAPRRADAVRAVEIVPLDAIVAVLV